MATKRDLVEAHAFSRRRLVTAFVSGAPGGREVEPARPGRTIVGGLALAALLVAGAAIAGVFAPRDPDDWRKQGLVVSKETGAAYVILEGSSDPVLRPVINITSARLVLPDDSAPTVVSQDTIDEQIIGDDIGILGAPASLPTPALLIDTGWTACTGDGLGVRVAVAETPQVQPAPSAGFLVESEDVFYVIAQAGPAGDTTPAAHRYELPPVLEADREGDEQDNLLSELGLPIREDAAAVSEDWLALFPPGGRLDFDSFGLTGFGTEVDYQSNPGVPAGSRVGDVVTVDGTDSSLLLTDRGPARLDAFARTVYRYATTPRGRLTPDARSGGSPVELHQDEPPTGLQTSAYVGAHWPEGVLDSVPGDPCAQLVTAPGEAPRVRVATAPGETAAATDLPAARRVASVSAGRGSYVLSGEWSDTVDGSPFVIDAKGRSYPLVGPEAAGRLGYGDHPVVVVPDSWVELFDRGVALSVQDALCPPAAREGRACG